MRLTEASRRYLMIRQQDGYSSYTLTAYRFQHQALIRDLGNPDVTTITLEDFRRHLGQYPHLQPASLGHKIRAIKSLFRWLEDEDLCVPNPTRKLKEPKLGQRVPKALTVDELEWIRDACVTTQDHALVEFFFMHLKTSQVPFSKWRRCPKMIPEFLLHVEKHRGIFLTELGSGPAT